MKYNNPNLAASKFASHSERSLFQSRFQSQGATKAFCKASRVEPEGPQGVFVADYVCCFLVGLLACSFGWLAGCLAWLPWLAWLAALAGCLGWLGSLLVCLLFVL